LRLIAARELSQLETWRVPTHVLPAARAGITRMEYRDQLKACMTESGITNIEAVLGTVDGLRPPAAGVDWMPRSLRDASPGHRQSIRRKLRLLTEDC
jgi:hypothetical protein